ncbi:MAG: tetratricopeptide repeat protein, partial [Planctomycetota bacterium]
MSHPQRAVVCHRCQSVAVNRRRVHRCSVRLVVRLVVLAALLLPSQQHATARQEPRPPELRPVVSEDSRELQGDGATVERRRGLPVSSQRAHLWCEPQPGASAQPLRQDGHFAERKATLTALLQSRNDESPSDRLLKSLRRQPRPGAAFDRLVQQLEQAGTLEDTITRLRTDLQSTSGEDDGSTAIILALFERHAHRYDSARTALTTAAKLRPRDPVVFWLLGSVALQLRDAAAAIESCETALTLKPATADLPGIARDLTAALAVAGRSAEIASVWTRIEALDPANLRLCEQAATALRNADLPQQALSRFQRLADELDDPWRRNQARLQVADLKRRLGQPQQALADEESILEELDPDSWQTRQVLDRIEDALLQAGKADDLQKLLSQRLERIGSQTELVQRLVRLLRLRNRSAEALQLLEQQLTKAPQDRSLRLLLIAEYVQGGQSAAAAAEYQQLAARGLLRPVDREAWGRLLLAGHADAQSAAERARQAAAIWRAGLTDPPVASDLRRLAELLRGAGLVADALPLLQQAVSLDPADALAREQLGSSLHALGRRDEALREWQKLAAGDRRSPEAFRELSSILRTHGEHRAAIEALRDACEVLPDTSDLLRLANAQAEFRDGTTHPLAADSLPVLTRAAAAAETYSDWQRVVEQQAATLQQLGQLDTVLQQLRNPSVMSVAALPAPELPLPPHLLSQLHIALLEHAAGNAERALDEVRQALSAAPSDPAVLQLAAVLSAAAGLPATALELQEQLLQQDSPGRITHLAAVMTLCRQQGLRQKAGEYAQALLQSAPEDPAMLTAAAEVLVECGRSDTAIVALESALRRQPEDSASALTLASLLAEQHQTSRALEICRQALEQATDDRARTELARLLAELYQQLGRPTEILQWLDDQIAEAEDLQRGRWLRTLAEIHTASGQTALASRALERVLQLVGPDTAVLLDLSELALQQHDPATAVATLQQINAAELEPAAARRLLDLALRSGPAGIATLNSAAGSPQLQTADHLSLLDRLLQQRRFPDAESFATRLCSTGRPAWEILLRLAVAQRRSGSVTAATASFRQLLQTPLPLDTPSADAVRSRPGKQRLRMPAGIHAANPESWDDVLENSTRILLDLSPQGDPDVFSEGWCESVAVARLLAVTGLLLSEHPHAPAAAPQTDTRTLASARTDWDAWVRGQLTAVTENTPRWSLTTALQLAAD